ncbi:hypothetical protein DNTS_034148 [Danionella cerebrum]|uniref:Uncharacterized protein n=1 Tax=Danionella cerebrum TaxID=2873325 RepID=A0A553R6X7_9TELE|nr:hypothetical protein DNTS_034148 [Danionella translucida]
MMLVCELRIPRKSVWEGPTSSTEGGVYEFGIHAEKVGFSTTDSASVRFKLTTGEEEQCLSPAEENSAEGNLCCGRWGPRRRSLKEMFTWQLFKTIAMGQGLSMLICGTAVTCQYLVNYRVEAPMLQSFLNYSLLLLTYTVVLAFRRGENNLVQILKKKWWKYFLMALTDVEANYTVVKAFQFTNLTSIQLLDCFVIPVLMMLSWIFLKTRYKPWHFVAVVVCLLGVGTMVGADILAGRDQGSSMLFVGYTICMYGLYSFMPLVVKLTSATAVNLSLLTADLFSLFCGIFLFQYKFTGLYIVSLVVIMLGFVMFNIVPTSTAAQTEDPENVAYHFASSVNVQRDTCNGEALHCDAGASVHPPSPLPPSPLPLIHMLLMEE